MIIADFLALQRMVRKKIVNLSDTSFLNTIKNVEKRGGNVKK